jgi:hypothetical protein
MSCRRHWIGVGPSAPECIPAIGALAKPSPNKLSRDCHYLKVVACMEAALRPAGSLRLPWRSQAKT